MPHGLKFMHVLLYGSLIVAVIALALFAIAGIGKLKE